MKPLATLGALALLALAALLAAWLALNWNVTVGGTSVPVWMPMAGLAVVLLCALGLAVETWRDARSERAVAREEGRAATRGQTRGGKSFTVHQGKRYKASISLSFFEAMASNDMIASKLQEVGFAEVKVTGSGNSRTAEALWTGRDTTAEMPSQVVSAVELPDPAVVQASAQAAAPKPAPQSST